jgi:hypothetical protein
MTPDYCDAQMDKDCNKPEHMRLQAVESKTNSKESTRDIMVNTICADLVPQDAVGHFLYAFGSVASPWYTLLCRTTPPDHIQSTDSWFVDALSALDLVITGQQDSSRLLARLAYVQLYRLLQILQRRVAFDRQVCRIRSRNRNSSIALDIYMAAQSCNPPSRRQLIERKNLAKRWSDLAGQWAIFVLLYSDDAEDIVFEQSILYYHIILLTFFFSVNAIDDPIAPHSSLWLGGFLIIGLVVCTIYAKLQSEGCKQLRSQTSKSM